MLQVEGHGGVRTVQRRAYDHSRGCYYAVVGLNDGREVVVTSPGYQGPYRVAWPYTIRPPARVEGT